MEISILTQIFLGFIQGITEWLPISSSAMITLIFVNLLDINNLDFILRETLFLHLGTFFAALIYFRKDILHLAKSIFKYKKSNLKTKKTLDFLILSTIISGIIGILFLYLINISSNYFLISGKIITLLVGLSLIFTGILGISTKKLSVKSYEDLQLKDGIILGILQGLASIPGISRSGITVSGLLIRKFDDGLALRLSFLMSLPIVLAGNILINLNDFSFTLNSLYGLFSSFIFGILTISFLMKLSKKINFAWFALIFGLLMIISFFV